MKSARKWHYLLPLYVMALLYLQCCIDFSKAAIISGQTTANNDTLPDTSVAITTVQEFLRAREQVPTLPVTGIWDTETRDHAISFLIYLQSQNLWHHSWGGPRDGEYSEEFAAYLKIITQDDEAKKTNYSDIYKLNEFIEAMDRLKKSAVFDGREKAHDSTTQMQSTGSLWWPPALWFANGALSGFGDEAYCAAFHFRESFSDCRQRAREMLDFFRKDYPFAAVGFNLAGACINVISAILVLIVVENELSGFSVLILSFSIGIFDGLLYIVGDYLTWGYDILDFYSISLQSILGGFVVTWMAFVQRWKHRDHTIRLDNDFNLRNQD
ncbi:hypothetical protein [Methylobacterium sp. GC_Met_2]|uniref:hypothetical protein n=1 Tax=Methylobacterium sp. GC_Met_2 TaxID=2937376 RepID=UPI00226B4EDF|nr:hypothetical protein [Methylobacterium sp. GC_Met_2]